MIHIALTFGENKDADVNINAAAQSDYPLSCVCTE